jgi:hypothetical protein
VATVSSGLASKSVASGFLVWASKLVWRFLGLDLNQTGYDLLVAPQNRWEDGDDAGHASRSSGLLRVEESRARISQFGLKTGGDATAGGARGTMRWAASDPTTLTLLFYVLAPRGIIVF